MNVDRDCLLTPFAFACCLFDSIYLIRLICCSKSDSIAALHKSVAEMVRRGSASEKLSVYEVWLGQTSLVISRYNKRLLSDFKINPSLCYAKFCVCWWFDPTWWQYREPGRPSPLDQVRVGQRRLAYIKCILKHTYWFRISNASGLAVEWGLNSNKCLHSRLNDCQIDIIFLHTVVIIVSVGAGGQICSLPFFWVCHWSV
jgi:hypothetical protein